MTLYLIATLLEHEMLIGLANEILLENSRHHHRTIPKEDLEQAHLLANKALILAREGM